MTARDIDIYKMAETPPEWGTKNITGGRLKGKNDINPQWRFEAMTQIYGLCGFGWWFEVTKMWTEMGQNDEIMAFCNLLLYVKHPDTGQESKPIQATGGAKLVAKETSGFHNDDDAFKKARTDALGKAMQMLGIGAQIYRNTYGTKYSDSQAVEDHVSAVDRRFGETLEELGVADQDFKDYLRSNRIKYSAMSDTEKELLMAKIRLQGGLFCEIKQSEGVDKEQAKKEEPASLEEMEL